LEIGGIGWLKLVNMEKEKKPEKQPVATDNYLDFVEWFRRKVGGPKITREERKNIIEKHK